MSNTQRGKYTFTIKEYGDGTPWIALEPSGKEIELPNEGQLGFDLNKGTNMKRATEIAKFLNENLSELSLTEF